MSDLAFLAQRLASLHEQLQDLGFALVPLHEMGDADTAAAISEIMTALIEQERALASLVAKVEKKAWA